MRIFVIIPLIIFPVKAWSQSCTGGTITTGVPGNTYNCTTLNISAGTYNFPANADVVRVIVTGDVVIDSGVVLDLKGADGVSDTTETQPGGVGGPGASGGGGNNFGPEDADNLPNGGERGTDDDIICAGGGGGGGFATAGNDGSACSVPNGGSGGLFYDINLLFRGGFGGGAGGFGDLGTPISIATGGGGGGALWISANNITNNGNIDVRGGSGGTGIAKSDGGGGGSGGMVRFQATGDIINNGTFLISGGAGGPGDATGTRGGNGSIGRFEMTDSDNIIAGAGTGAIGNGSDEESFSSSISCGALKMKNDQNVFQMIAGFMLIILISKIRGRVRRSI